MKYVFLLDRVHDDPYIKIGSEGNFIFLNFMMDDNNTQFKLY